MSNYLTRDELDVILNNGDFSLLVGRVENGCWDGKGAPYQIDQEYGKHDLAEDVVSFANSDGGVILIGVKTIASSVHFSDEVVSVSPFVESLVNGTQYLNVLNEWVYPKMQDVQIEWIEDGANPGKGIVAIKIPLQAQDNRPFLVTKSLDESGRKIKNAFGYSRRKGEGNIPSTVHELHRWLKLGMSYNQEFKNRFDALEVLVRNNFENQSGLSSKKINEIPYRLIFLLKEQEKKDKSTLTLFAYPDIASDLKSLFSSSVGSIRRKLENPPTLRRNGWDIATQSQVQFLQGKMARVVDKNITVDLYRDGCMLVAAPADENFLAWGSQDEIRKLNPLALVEFVFSFTTFYEQVIQDLKETPKNVTFEMSINGLWSDEKRTLLSPGEIRHFSQLAEAHDAPKAYFTNAWTFSVEKYHSAEIAFEILKEIYIYFGFEEEAVPYTKMNGDKRLIDAEYLSKQ